MKTPSRAALKAIAILGLILSVLSGMMFFGGSLSKDTYHGLMVIGMLMWFGSAIFWIKAKSLG